MDAPVPSRDAIVTGKSVVSWSIDGTTVTKRAVRDHVDPVLGRYRAAGRNEIRINRLLSNAAPPVPTPRLVSWSAHDRSMTFEAVDGAPLGPKFPTALLPTDVADLIALARALGPFQPRRRWFRRLDVERRLRQFVRAALLSHADADAVLALARERRIGWQFAHADLTARNVLRRTDGELVLIDWEWAGLYPTGYELAFLWFSLSDMPDARDAVARAVPDRQRPGFLLSAILIQLLHLHLFRNIDSPYLPRHHATLDELIRQVPGHRSPQQ